MCRCSMAMFEIQLIENQIILYIFISQICAFGKLCKNAHFCVRMRLCTFWSDWSKWNSSQFSPSTKTDRATKSCTFKVHTQNSQCRTVNFYTSLRFYSLCLQGKHLARNIFCAVRSNVHLFMRNTLKRPLNVFGVHSPSTFLQNISNSCFPRHFPYFHVRLLNCGM